MNSRSESVRDANFIMMWWVTVYARVDVVRNETDQSWLLMELELIEPYLFLALGMLMMGTLAVVVCSPLPHPALIINAGVLG